MSSETTATCAARALKTTTLPHAPPKISDPLPCPRCQSVNTKFCYYNNYNLSQPRHFCKSCRRYWTHGGALRNVPVGGGTRKNSKRCRSSSSQMESTSSTATATTRVFAQKPAPRPELLASDPNPEFPQNFISLPSIAQQEPGFIFGYGFGHGVWGIGELGDGGEMCSGDCFAWPSIAVSMPAEGLK